MKTKPIQISSKTNRSHFGSSHFGSSHLSWGASYGHACGVSSPWRADMEMSYATRWRRSGRCLNYQWVRRCAWVYQRELLVGSETKTVLPADVLATNQGLADLARRLGHNGLGGLEWWLRENGRGDLSTRISRLNKARNAAAHPDSTLLVDLETYVGEK